MRWRCAAAAHSINAIRGARNGTHGMARGARVLCLHVTFVRNAETKCGRCTLLYQIL